MSEQHANAVLLGLGANLGDPAQQLREALRLLAQVVTIDSVSSVYRTQPVGGIPQPDFLNIVCRVSTRLDPFALHDELMAIEARIGRTRRVRNGPRVIDIDLLAYDDLVVDSPRLIVPHPRMHQRAFVLVPLVEIEPDWRHPLLGRTAVEILSGLGSGDRVDRIGDLAALKSRG